MQLSELVKIERPERAMHRQCEHPEHDDDQEDIEGCAELDDERHAGGQQEREECDAVVANDYAGFEMR